MNVLIRTKSEFNVQAELYIKLREQLEPLGFEVFGEVRLMDTNKTCDSVGNFTRKQKGRLDIAILKNNKIICAIEVKANKPTGYKKQKKLYLNLGVPKIFLCCYNQIDATIDNCKKYVMT